MHLLSITGKMFFQVTGSTRYNYFKIEENKPAEGSSYCGFFDFINIKIALKKGLHNRIHINFITFK